MIFRDRAQAVLHAILQPVVRLFISLRISPNMVTTIGLLLNVVVVIIFISGAEKGSRGDLSFVGWGGGTILFAGLFDMIDGQVARQRNMSSRFGALYDSVLDRYSEMLMFLGICFYLVAHHYFVSSLMSFVAMIGSIMVSYTRARAEGLGVPCKDGLMQRPERIIVIGLSALLCGIIAHYTGGEKKWTWEAFSWFSIETISIFTIPLSIVAILANYTAFQRLYACYVFLQNADINQDKK